MAGEPVPQGYPTVNAIIIGDISSTTTGSGGTSTLANKSSTIALGGTAQTLAAANSSRRGLWVQSQSTGDLWVSEVGTAAATQPSVWLPPGSYYNFDAVPVGAVSIFGATTGQAFAAREW